MTRVLSRILLASGMLVLLMATGCAPKASTKTPEQSEYEHSAEARLAEVGARIDTLKAHVDAAGDTAKVEARKQVAELEVQRDQAKVKLDELRASTVNTWENAKTALAVELDSLDSKFDRAREHMRQ